MAGDLSTLAAAGVTLAAAGLGAVIGVLARTPQPVDATRSPETMRAETRHVVAVAVAREREACARIAANLNTTANGNQKEARGFTRACHQIAGAIRARGAREEQAS